MRSIAARRTSHQTATATSEEPGLDLLPQLSGGVFSEVGTVRRLVTLDMVHDVHLEHAFVVLHTMHGTCFASGN